MTLANRLAARAAGAVLLGTLTAIAVVAGAAPPAAAHTGLISSSPTDRATLTAAPREVRLVFGDRIAAQFSAVTLTVGDGRPQVLSARTDGPEVTAAIDPVAPADRRQDWTLDYRVVSGDGHPISGSVTFSVLASPPRPAAATPTEAGSGGQGSPTPSPGRVPASTAAPAPPTNNRDAVPDPRLSRGWLLLGLVAVAAFLIGAAYLGISVQSTFRQPAPRDPNPPPAGGSDQKMP